MDIKLIVSENKKLELKKNVNVYVGENKINRFKVVLPDSGKFCGYNLADCQVELREVLPDNTYVSEIINQNNPYVYITLDITSEPQTVNLLFVVTKDGNVIGETNTEELRIQQNKDGGTSIDPREELDEIIAELRADKAELEETVSEQAETIASQSSQITTLSGEVDELTTENTLLETQHTADQNTIQYLIDNPPEAHLQPKSVTPTSQMQVVKPDEDYQGLAMVTVGAVTPPRLQSKQVSPSESTTYVTADSNYDGLSSVTVSNVDASIDSDIQPENIREGVEILGVEGTYNPFPEHSVGGIYITEVDEDGYPVKFLVKNYEKTQSEFPQFFDKSQLAIRALREIVFENCPNITTFQTQCFANLTYLKKIILPNHLTTITINAFSNCRSLVEIILPNSLVTLEYQAFLNCSELNKIVIHNSLQTIGNNVFFYCSNIIDLIIAEGFNCNNLNVSSSTRFTAETIVSCLEALADRTGETAYTITFGSTNLNKLTAEQKAIAINKNWNLA